MVKGLVTKGYRLVALCFGRICAFTALGSTMFVETNPSK